MWKMIRNETMPEFRKVSLLRALETLIHPLPVDASFFVTTTDVEIRFNDEQ